MAYTSNVDILGVMDESNDVFNPRGNIFINTWQVLQFRIRPISDVPDNYNAEYYTGFSDRISNYFIDDTSLSDHERIDRLKDFLQDKVFIFNVEIQRSSGKTYHVATNIRIQSKSEHFRSNNTFIPVPIFSQETHQHGYQTFKRRLLEEKPVGRIDNVATGPNDTPQLVFWQHDNDQLELFGEFDSHLYVYGGYQLRSNRGQGALKSYGPFMPTWLDDAYEANGTVLFTPREAYQELVHTLKSDLAVDVETETEPTGIEQKKEPVSVDATTTQNETSSVSSTVSSDKEIEFLHHFKDVTRSLGLQYAEEDLWNFHISMKSSTLTILAGLSGTGKSKLVQAYAKALGRRHNLVFIPVRPSWSDDADLLGYADMMHMIYRPGDSGLMNTLVEAVKPENQDKMYIVCFDEMNLARVEHYFSQMLSALERDPGDRRLHLYNKDLENRLYNAANYPPEIEIGDNVLFAGTVNLDESTYHFSDKVLDRANLIELDVLPFAQLQEIQPQALPEIDWTGELYGGFRQFSDQYTLTPEELSFLWDLHREMQAASKGMGIGPRIVRQMDLYIKNIPVGAPISRADAFDRLLCQRVLTKLRGPEEMLVSLIRHDAISEKQGAILRLIDQNSSISEFTRTRALLAAKWNEVRMNGYAI